MPYVDCSQCHLRSFTAARYSTSDTCPGCGAPLQRSRDRSARPRMLAATAAALRSSRADRERTRQLQREQPG